MVPNLIKINTFGTKINYNSAKSCVFEHIWHYYNCNEELLTHRTVGFAIVFLTQQAHFVGYNTTKLFWFNKELPTGLQQLKNPNHQCASHKSFFESGVQGKAYPQVIPE